MRAHEPSSKKGATELGDGGLATVFFFLQTSEDAGHEGWSQKVE